MMKDTDQKSIDNQLTDLKPCLYCEYEKPQPMERQTEDGRIIYFVHCPLCHAAGPCCNAKRDLTMEEALNAWNRRRVLNLAPLDEAIAFFKDSPWEEMFTTQVIEGLEEIRAKYQTRCGA